MFWGNLILAARLVSFVMQSHSCKKTSLYCYNIIIDILSYNMHVVLPFMHAGRSVFRLFMQHVFRHILFLFWPVSVLVCLFPSCSSSSY